MSSQTRDPHVALPAVLAFLVLMAAFAGTSLAQTVPPPSGTGPGQSASERAAKEADKVFQWIRIHSDKPRKASAAEKAEPESAVIAAPPAAIGAPARPVARSPAKAALGSVGNATSKAASRDDRLIAAKPASKVDRISLAVETQDPSAPNAFVATSPEQEADIVLTPVTTSEPRFPSALMRQLRKGTVQVAFTVQPDGTVTGARAVTSTHPRLSSSAVMTVQEWKFKPIRQAKQAVVDLGFDLD